MNRTNSLIMIARRSPDRGPRLPGWWWLFLAAAALTGVTPARAQTTVTWSNSGGSAWLTGSNWAGNAVPGTTAIAQFGTTPSGTAVGINFNGTLNIGSGTQGVGAIEVTSARTNDLRIGNSSTTTGANGVLLLSGTTVNGTSNVILRNSSNTGTLILSPTSSGGSQSMTVALGNATDNVVLVDGSAGITITSTVTGAARGLTLAGVGSGTLTLSAANTYSGGTKLSSGVLSYGNVSSLGSGTVTFTGGSRLLAGVAGTLANPIVVNTGVTGTFDSGANATTLSGTLGGAGTLVKVGSATLTLSGTSVSTGTLSLAAGQISVSSSAALGTMTLNPTLAASQQLNYTNQAAGTIAGPIVLGAPGSATTFTVVKSASSSSTGTDLNFAGPISGGNANATLFLNSNTSGDSTTTYTLSGTNTFRGKININRGCLVVSSTGALGDPLNLVVLDSNVNNTDGNLRFGVSGTFANPVQITTAGLYTISTGSNDVVVSGSIFGNTLTKLGTGRLTLTGSNSYPATTISSGTLQIGNGGTAGTLGTGTVSVANGATLAFQRSDSYGGTVSNVITGSGGVAVNAGSLTLGGTNTFTGGLTLGPATLSISSSAAIGSGTVSVTAVSTLNVTGAAASFDNAFAVGALSGRWTLATPNNSSTVFNGVISGGGTAAELFFQGGASGQNSGALTLNGTNTFAGTINVQRGPLILGNGSAAGTAKIRLDSNANPNGALQLGSFAIANTVELNAGALVGVAGTNSGTIAGPMTSTAATAFIKVGSGTLTLTGTNTYAGATQINAGTLRIGAGGTAGTLGSGSVTISSGATLAFNRGDDYGGAVSRVISGSGGMTLAGGTLTLSGSNSLTGGTVVNGGVLRLGHANALGPATAAVTVASGTLDLAGYSPTFGSFDGAGTITSVAAATITGSAAGNFTFPGTVSGAVSVRQAGAGTLTLSGTGATTGSLAVANGTVLLTGSLGAPATVAANATLAGTGILGGTATVASLGTLSPGVGNVGTLTLAAASFSGTGTIAVGVQGGTTTSLLNLVNGITTSAGAGSVVFGFGSQLYTVATGTYTLLTYGGPQLADTSAFGWSGAAGARQAFAFRNDPQALNFVVSTAYPIWSGTAGSDWLAGGNWVLSSDGSPTTYIQGDTVVFDDSGVTGTVTLSAAVAPTTTTFSGTMLAYTLSSAGGFGITSGALVKSGPATVTISTSNSFAGGTTLSAGTLVLGDVAALGTGTVAFTAPATLQAAVSGTLANALSIATAVTGTFDTQAGNLTLSAPVSGAGTFLKAGAGTLTLTGTASHTGGTTIASGTLRVGAGGTAGALPAAAVTGSAGATLAFNRSDSVTFSGTIGGGIGLAQLGSGTLTLSASNAYTGGTVVNAGAVRLGNTGGLGATTGPLTVNAGTVDLATFSPTVGTLSGSASAVITSTSAVTLTAGGAADGTYAGTISGSIALVKTGAGALTLSASNSYARGTTLSGGRLVLGNAAALGSPTASLSLVSGTLDLAGSSPTIGLLTGSAGAAITSASPATLTGSSASDGTYAGTIGGATAVVKQGAGTLTLSGSNTFSGGVALQQGVLSIGAAAGLGTGTFSIGSNAAQFSYTGSTSTTIANPIALGNSGTTSVRVTVLKAAAGAADINLTGAIAGGGTAVQLFFNTGDANSLSTLTLSGSNTFRVSNIWLNRGSLVVNNLSAFGDPANEVVINSYVDNSVGNLRFAVSGTFANPINNVQSNFDNTIGTAANTVVLTGNIYGAGGLTKYGSGLLVVTGSNSYANGTNVRDGTLQIGNGGTAGMLGGGNVSVSSGATIAFNRSDDYGGSLSKVVSGSGGLSLLAGTLTLTGSNPYTGVTSLNGGILALGTSTALAGSGTITFGGGTLRFSAANTVDYATRIRSSTSAVALDTNGRDVTFAGAIDATNTAGLVKSGAGTLALTSAANAYTGDTTISSGTLRIGGVGQLGGGSYAGTVTNAGVLDVATSANQTLAGTISGTGALLKSGVGTLTLSGSSDYSGGTQVNGGTLAFANGALGSGNVTLAASTVLRWAAGNTQDVSSRLVLPSSGNVTLDVGTNNVALASGLGVGSSASLTKAGAGTLTLTGTTGYPGATTVSTGTLAVAGAGNLASTVVTLPYGAALDISGATAPVSVGGLTSNLGSDVYVGTNTLVATFAGNANFDGGLHGSGGFTKDGAGTLAITSLQDFTGRVTVAAGELDINDASYLQSANTIYVASGATLSGPAGLAVAAAQTLGGYGTVAGNLSFASGGILSPGGSVGTLFADNTTGGGTVTLSGGMRYLFEVNSGTGTPGGPTGWDLFNVSGALTLSATDTNPIIVDVTSLSDASPGLAANFDPTLNYAWKFVMAGSEIGGFSQNMFSVVATNFQNDHPGTFYVARGDQLTSDFGSGTSSELFVVYAAVPEPGALALAGIGLAAIGVGAARRRRNRHANSAG